MSHTISVMIEDQFGGRTVEAEAPTDADFAELVDVFLAEMQLPRTDGQGRPIHWGAEVDGIQMDAGSRLEDVLPAPDPGETHHTPRPRIRIVPSVDAGAGTSAEDRPCGAGPGAACASRAGDVQPPGKRCR